MSGGPELEKRPFRAFSANCGTIGPMDRSLVSPFFYLPPQTQETNGCQIMLSLFYAIISSSEWLDTGNSWSSPDILPLVVYVFYQSATDDDFRNFE